MNSKKFLLKDALFPEPLFPEPLFPNFGCGAPWPASSRRMYSLTAALVVLLNATANLNTYARELNTISPSLSVAIAPCRPATATNPHKYDLSEMVYDQYGIQIWNEEGLRNVIRLSVRQ